MISEIDIRDWNRKIEKARESLSKTDPSGEYYFTDRVAISAFIDQVENYFKANSKQIAALFKAPALPKG